METPQARYPIGIENFEKIRKEDFLYVDKTEYLHMMLQTSGYYLLCPPRRFGKSLFLSAPVLKKGN